MQNYISLDTGEEKKTNGEVGESVSRCGASLPRIATESNEGPNLTDRNLSKCIQKLKIKKFSSFGQNMHAIDGWNRLDKTIAMVLAARSESALPAL
jgi:hypothetical protein